MGRKVLVVVEVAPGDGVGQCPVDDHHDDVAQAEADDDHLLGEEGRRLLHFVFVHFEFELFDFLNH